MVTAGMRSMGADASARRLLGRTWKGLARLARSRSAPDPAAFAAVLVDRLGLLTPKLAMAGSREDLVGVDALRDLRVGMNLVAIQAARPALPRGGQARIDAVLDGVGDHFSALAIGRGAPPSPDLLARLDTALRDVADAASRSAAPRSLAPRSPWGVAGLVGLRRNLFPDAPAPDLSLPPEPAR